MARHVHWLPTQLKVIFCNIDYVDVYKKQIFLYTLLKEPHYLFFIKAGTTMAYCLLHACHTFCDELISLL